MNQLAASKYLDELRDDITKSQRKGLPFIMASVIIWSMILVVTQLDLSVETRNLITFCCSCPLMPLACIFGKKLKVDIFEKNNPLTKLGLLFTINQMLYLLIVMWAFSAVPEKMVMIYAIVFGAHLLPYSWLYKSKGYVIFSIIEPIAALATGCIFGSGIVAAVMIVAEISFTIVLFLEEKK